MKKISSNKQQEIVQLLRNGNTHRQIAKKLNVSLDTVAKIRRIHCADVPRAKSSPKARLTPAVQRRVIRQIVCGVHAVQVSRELASVDQIHVTPAVVCKVLRKHGFKGRAKVKKTLSEH